MNDLVMIGNQEVVIKEYDGKRVVTFKDIDRVHERPEGTARKRFNDNRKHFIEGEDFYKVKCSEVRPFFGQTPPNGFNPEADITLITETGYLMLVKSFTDDLAWKVQRQLVNRYFRKEEEKSYFPTRPLTTDDYEDAARTVAKCHNSRLPIVLDLYRKAGLDVPKIEGAAAPDDDADLERIREILERYSLRKAAALCGIPTTSLMYYRRGIRTPPAERRELIINILG